VELAELQRKTLGLLKGTYEPRAGDDGYLHDLAASPNLTLAREVVLWWHTFRVEQFCPITASFLARRNLLDTAVADAHRDVTLSHFVEETGEMFLDYMASRGDAVVAALAAFERALVRVRRGDPEAYAVSWTVDPRHVFDCFLNGETFAPEKHAGRFSTIISSQLPLMIKVIDHSRQAHENVETSTA
jgi:hypothetical protein